jgi:hypothetical protein
MLGATNNVVSERVLSVVDITNGEIKNPLITNGTHEETTVKFLPEFDGYRVVSKIRLDTITSAQVRVYFSNNENDVNFDGNGVDSAIIWGAQLEADANATSYIKTVASTVTRNADVISKTGISDLIGQTEGTLYIDLDYTQPPADPSGRLLTVYNTNDTTNSIVPLINGVGPNVNQFQLITFSGSAFASVIAPSAATILPFGQNKFAIAYNAGNYTVYRNGLLLGSGTALAPASFTAILLGSSPFFARSINNRIRAAAILPTRLSNAQLEALTTL